MLESSWGMNEVQLILSTLLHIALASKSLALPVQEDAERISSNLKTASEEEGGHLKSMFHQDDFQQGEARLQINLCHWVAKILKSLW